MGLFSNSSKKEDTPRLPELPQLPELPELPDWENSRENQMISPLPSFPKNSVGEKLSQSTIKDAMAGEKEEDFEADESGEDDFEEVEGSGRGFPRTAEIGSPYALNKRDEPIFVRLDKFEESLKLFEKTREQISEIQHVLGQIKRIKEQEEHELQYWEQEIQKIKGQIERIDKDIFSKVE